LARALDIPFTEIADLVDHLEINAAKKPEEVDSQTN